MPEHHQPLAGRRALVTGASRGIGRGIALALARAGAHVAIHYRQAEEQASSLLAEITRLGGEAYKIKADVAHPREIDVMLTRVQAELGHIDILVNNAGISRPLPIENISLDDWNETIDVNLRSAFLVTQGCLPHMRSQRWGRIIFVSSVAAQIGGIVGPHYAASKAGMHGLMHYYAAHFAKEGITSNVVAPALIKTDMMAANPNSSATHIPVGHFGEVTDVASVVLLLAENSYITGQTFNVNGGWYAS